jgi:PUA domain protein
MIALLLYLNLLDLNLSREKSMPQKRCYLKEKEAKDLINKASQRLKVNLEELVGIKAKVEVVQTDFAQIYIINHKSVLAKTEEDVFPTLAFTELLDMIPKAIIDMGAVPYVCKGANIMAPGIRNYEKEFVKGDLIAVIDEKHHKPIAVGESLCDVEEARKTVKGAVIRNVHFVGDKVWNFIKTLQ